MPRRPHLQTQFVIFVLFGDVIVHRGGQVWTGGLLRMLAELGVTERAARSTLSRMRRKGWLKTERNGRHSLYTLTARGRRILEEGGQRIFEPRLAEWDGRWRLVVYSLPENKRRLRNDLRKRLAWQGFGRLAPGTWIAPHTRMADVKSLVDELEAHAFVEIFSGLRLEGSDDHEIVERCWDLKSLNQQYARFISRWEPEYERCLRAQRHGDQLPAAECFAQRFWITHEFSPFPRLDPKLPTVLLPDGWLGDQAAQLFHNYRAALTERANEFIADAFVDPNEARMAARPEAV